MCACACVRSHSSPGLASVRLCSFLSARFPALKEGSTRETTDPCCASEGHVSYQSICPLQGPWCCLESLKWALCFHQGLFHPSCSCLTHSVPYPKGEFTVAVLSQVVCFCFCFNLILGTCDIWRHSLLFLPGRMGVSGPCSEGALLGHKARELPECCPG